MGTKFQFITKENIIDFVSRSTSGSTIKKEDSFLLVGFKSIIRYKVILSNEIRCY